MRVNMGPVVRDHRFAAPKATPQQRQLWDVVDRRLGRLLTRDTIIFDPS
jgi:hypothetical protein